MNKNSPVVIPFIYAGFRSRGIAWISKFTLVESVVHKFVGATFIFKDFKGFVKIANFFVTFPF